MASNVDLNSRIGSLIKIVSQETPQAPVEVRKGRLLAFDDDFLKIQTFENIHLISRKTILSVKVFGAENKEAGR